MPKPHDQRTALVATWWRAPEDDAGANTGFRKEGQPLPPARGRRGFTLHGDGRATLHGPGPTDRRENTESRWQIDEQGRLTVEGVPEATGRPIALLDEQALQLGP